MKSLLLKIGAFFIGLLAVFKLGQAKAEIKTAEKEVENVNKQIEKTNTIYNKPFVNKPFSKLRNKKKL